MARFTLDSYIDRVWQGVIFGLVIAAIYSVYVIALYVIRGSDAFDRANVGLLQVIVTYFGGGILAGGTIGLLFPLTRYRLGAIVVYSTAAFFVFLCIAISERGAIQLLQADDWHACMTLGLLFGSMFGLIGKHLWHGNRFN